MQAYRIKIQSVQMASAIAISKINLPSAVDGLINAARSSNYDVRLFGLTILAARKEPRAKDVFLAARSDGNQKIMSKGSEGLQESAMTKKLTTGSEKLRQAQTDGSPHGLVSNGDDAAPSDSDTLSAYRF